MRLVRSLLLTSMFIMLVSAVAVSIVFAGGYGDKAMTGSTKGDMTSSLQVLEVKINDAFKNRDTKTFLSIVDADGWSVDATGFTPVKDVAGMFNDIEVKNYSIEGYRAMMIDPNVYVATYTWRGQVSYKGQPFPPTAYCSTVWAKHGKDWKAIFHQESVPMEEIQTSSAATH
jgi:hypothetical protein